MSETHGSTGRISHDCSDRGAANISHKTSSSRPQPSPRLSCLPLQGAELLHHAKRELRVSEPVTLSNDFGVEQ
jgi:hypothetical protein